MDDCDMLIGMFSQYTTTTLDKLSWISCTCTENCKFASWNINTFIQTFHGRKHFDITSRKFTQHFVSVLNTRYELLYRSCWTNFLNNLSVFVNQLIYIHIISWIVGCSILSGTVKLHTLRNINKCIFETSAFFKALPYDLSEYFFLILGFMNDSLTFE